MKFVPLFLLCCISSAAAQTFHIEPANPILVGEPLSIQMDGLPSDKNVTVTAERTMAATSPQGSPVLYRSQAIFSAPQGALDPADVRDDRVHRLAARSESPASQGIPRRRVCHAARNRTPACAHPARGFRGRRAGCARSLATLRVARIRGARASLLFTRCERS